MPRAKLRIASGARLTDCYQSWLNFRGSYTPQEPINSSSRNELEAQARSRHQTRDTEVFAGVRGIKMKALRDLARVTFSYFSEAPENSL